MVVLLGVVCCFVSYGCLTVLFPDLILSFNVVLFRVCCVFVLLWSGGGVVVVVGVPLVSGGLYSCP